MNIVAELPAKNCDTVPHLVSWCRPGTTDVHRRFDPTEATGGWSELGQGHHTRYSERETGWPALKQLAVKADRQLTAEGVGANA